MLACQTLKLHNVCGETALIAVKVTSLRDLVDGMVGVLVCGVTLLLRAYHRLSLI